MGKGRGDKFLYDKVSNVSTAGGALTETTTIPRNNLTISQSTVTISEYGAAIAWTGKLATLANWEVPEIVRKALYDDAAKVLDSVAGSQFTAADTKVVCVSTASVNIQTAGTASATATANLSAYNLREIVNHMKRNNVPPYDGEFYVCIASPTLLLGLRQDTAAGGWYDLTKYTDSQVRRALSGEIGAFHGVRFVEETNFLSNAIGSGSAYGEGVIFGADAVCEAIAIPDEIRMDLPRDFGRDNALAWYFVGGFAQIRDRSTDTDFSTIHITSL